MSDSKNNRADFSFSQSEAGEPAVENDRPHYNSKHVSFVQKQAMLSFMMDHMELAMSNNNDEILWNNLTQILNNVPVSAVRPTDFWKKTWKSWVESVQKKQHDLSITLLELKLQSFLERVAEAENFRTMIIAFIGGQQFLNSQQLSSIAQEFPKILMDETFQNLVEKLKELELNEVSLKSLIDAGTNRLSELLVLKQEVENEANAIINKLDLNENETLLIHVDKMGILNEIRRHLNLKKYLD